MAVQQVEHEKTDAWNEPEQKEEQPEGGRIHPSSRPGGADNWGRETLPVMPTLAFAGLGRIDASNPYPYDFHSDGPLAKW